MKITKCPPGYAEGYRPQSNVGFSQNADREHLSVMEHLELLAGNKGYAKNLGYDFNRDGNKHDE